METDIAEEYKLVPANNKFANQLYKVLKQNNGNVLFSPFNVSTCMGMLYLMTDGSTREELLQALHLHGIDYDSLVSEFEKMHNLINEEEFCCSNGILLDNDYKMKPSYKELIQKCMGAIVENIDFKNEPENSRKLVNSWISSTTNGKIHELLSQGSISNMSRVVFASGLYFKGTWDSPFNEENTKEMSFHLTDGCKKKVQMMIQTNYNFRYCYIPSLDAEALQIPYKNFNQSLLIILPHDIDGLPELENKISNIDFQCDIIETLKTRGKIEVAIPKLNLECSYDLRTSLQQMGVKNIFCDPKWDFLMGSETPGLSVSAVYHKCVIYMDEEGTEAAASACACVMLKSRPKLFTADHPFLFAILETKSRSLMFFGRYASPS